MTLERCLVHQDHERGVEWLFHDYLANDSVFDNATFQERYKMQRDLFLHLVDIVTKFDP